VLHVLLHTYRTISVPIRSESHPQPQPTPSTSQLRITKHPPIMPEEQPFRFLDLPPELRDHIYESAVYTGTLYPSTRRESSSNQATQPPITRASRQLRKESLPLFYSTNSFAMHPCCVHCTCDRPNGGSCEKITGNVAASAFMKWFESIGYANIRHIHKITVFWGPSPSRSYHIVDLVQDLTKRKLVAEERYSFRTGGRTVYFCPESSSNTRSGKLSQPPYSALRPLLEGLMRRDSEPGLSWQGMKDILELVQIPSTWDPKPNHGSD